MEGGTTLPRPQLRRFRSAIDRRSARKSLASTMSRQSGKVGARDPLQASPDDNQRTHSEPALSSSRRDAAFQGDICRREQLHRRTRLDRGLEIPLQRFHRAGDSSRQFVGGQDDKGR